MSDSTNALAVLRQLEARYNRLDYINQDPLGLVLELEPAQREVGALIAALLAYGNVKAVRASVRSAYGRLDHRPLDALLEWSAERLANSSKGFKHRWTNETDWTRFLMMLQTQLRRHGSLAAGFQSVGGEGSLAERSGRWIGALTSADARPLSRGLKFLIPSPVDGGAAKRLMLFLKWVVRREAPDLGIWDFIEPSQLIMPMDTHMVRIARAFRWTSRKTANMSMALEMTSALAQFDPLDPTRYDFALGRPGMHRECPFTGSQRLPRKAQCGLCGKSPACETAQLLISRKKKTNHAQRRAR